MISLQKGDSVAIVATAKKTSIIDISYTVQWLENLDLKVIIGKTIGTEHNQLAGTDAERAFDLQNQINNPKVKAIWFARGGYGTVRIIDKIDFSVISENPKWFIGYSDITVLHSHLHTLKIKTLHAPLAFDFQEASQKTKKNLENILFGKDTLVEFSPDLQNKTGKAKGIAIGGNLSILYSLCGSVSNINTKGKILFIEDLDEYLYHIDRMLQNLKRNQFFTELSGLVVGGFTKLHDQKIPFGYTVKEMILEITKSYNYPVVFDAPFGHISDNCPVVFGEEILLNVTKDKVSLASV